MASLIALKPRAVALLRAAILFAAKDDVREQLTAVCIDPDPAAGRVRIVATDKNMMFVATAPARLYGKTAPVLLSVASLKPARSGRPRPRLRLIRSYLGRSAKPRSCWTIVPASRLMSDFLRRMRWGRSALRFRLTPSRRSCRCAQSLRSMRTCTQRSFKPRRPHQSTPAASKGGQIWSIES